MKYFQNNNAFHNFHSNKYLLLPLFFLIFLSMPGEAKCDAGDVISSFLLICILLVVIFAGIGWWSKRTENK